MSTDTEKKEVEKLGLDIKAELEDAMATKREIVDVEAGAKAMCDLMNQGSSYEASSPMRRGAYINQAKACAKAWGLTIDTDIEDGARS